MPKATFKLPDGTLVTIDGTLEEVKKLLESYGGAGKASSTGTRNKKKTASGKSSKKSAEKAHDEKPDLAEIINQIKDCSKAEIIETQILDRTSMVNRILLPLYIVHEYLDNAYGLTSGEISKITTDLSVPISTSNASKHIARSASKYITGDSVKKQGKTVRYKLNRRGVKYLNEILTESSDGK
ncbi:MAG: hypothetical protein E3J72_03590 [Planctomycetota bacterium]|nr:MAG: hypothetical protein E3J72_03590 [Planctomycetota bacterium]